ncbi:DUF6456 domain-containing protein [Mesorhizobium sp. A623]
MTKSKTATKAAKPKVSKMPKGEADQVRIRRDLGHDFALKQDEHGRTRLIAGSVDARRVYEVVSNDGHISTGGIVRVRKIDPLKGILSLTDRQRGAGLRYREDFELAAREGLKTGTFQERVDGGGMTASISARLLDNHAAMHDAREAVGYPEIVVVLDAICGLGMSISELAAKESVVRDIPAQLLRMGLERLVVHYRNQQASRHD